MHTLDYSVRRLIDWFVRPRSRGILLIKSGAGIIIAFLGGGWLAGIDLSFPDFTIEATLEAPGGLPALLIYAICVVALVLIFVGCVMEIFSYTDERTTLARRKTVVIEARGLRDFAGTPLIQCLPTTYPRKREEVLLDLRQRIHDSEISEPAPLLEVVENLPRSVHQHESGRDRADIVRVYGGLAAVPLTFLTGTVLDDEISIDVYDWDRHESRWRPLDAADDGDRLTTHGLTHIPEGTFEAVLAISISYQSDRDAIATTFPDFPAIYSELGEVSSDAHWSEEKQVALGRQFLDTAKNLAERGVMKLHLILAAPNSIVFRFGRLYDKRNLPAVSVYQYERRPYPHYPWAIAMPVSGKRWGQIERPNHTTESE